MKTVLYLIDKLAATNIDVRFIFDKRFLLAAIAVLCILLVSASISAYTSRKHIS